MRIGEEISLWGEKSFRLHVVDGETSFVSLLIYSWQIYLEYMQESVVLKENKEYTIPRFQL